VGWPDRHKILHFEDSQLIRALLEGSRSLNGPLLIPAKSTFFGTDIPDSMVTESMPSVPGMI
jgi:hypothetical protein